MEHDFLLIFLVSWLLVGLNKLDFIYTNAIYNIWY